MSAATDAIQSRNSTQINLILNGSRVGRVQTFSKSQSNNVQVLAELGNEFMAEMLKGITSYKFSITRFYARNDIFDDLAAGAVFSLQVTDATGAPQSIEYFRQCMIDSIETTISAGQATVAQNASVVTIGQGIKPTNL